MFKRFRKVLWLSLMPVFISICGRALANGPPINGETAFVTGLNGSAVRSFVKVINKSGESGSMRAIMLPVVIPYEAVDNKLVLGIGLPFVSKTLTPKEGDKRSSKFGSGDLFTFAKIGLLQEDSHQNTFRVAAKFGLSFPTGTDNASDDQGVLPPPLQRGTGTVSPSIMLIGTRLWHKFGINFDIGYKALPEANNLDRGDVYQFDIATSYRILPNVFKTYPDHQLNLMFELNGTTTKKTRVNGLENANTGGTVAYLSPGLQYMYSTLILEASVQVPTLVSLNGDGQMEPDWNALSGFRWLID